MESKMKLFDYELPRIPEFCMSHWLLRIPLAIIFIQQGLMKFPIDVEEAESYGLSYLVWWFVAYGELLGGIGLIVGGILALRYINLWEWVGDVITRFSGVTLCCIMTGVIWVGEPESFMDVILYDNLHVLLWVGALFFALRGNNAK